MLLLWDFRVEEKVRGFISIYVSNHPLLQLLYNQSHTALYILIPHPEKNRLSLLSWIKEQVEDRGTRFSMAWITETARNSSLVIKFNLQFIGSITVDRAGKLSLRNAYGGQSVRRLLRLVTLDRSWQRRLGAAACSYRLEIVKGRLCQTTHFAGNVTNFL